MIRFRPDTALKVTYVDETPFGSPVGHRADDMVREVFGPLIARLQRDGVRIADHNRNPEILNEIRAGWLFRAMTISHSDGTWSVRDEVLYPAADRARPSVITAAGDNAGESTCIRLPASHWAGAHAAISALCGDGISDFELSRLPVDIRSMVQAFLNNGLTHCENESRSGVSRALQNADLTFVGHNTVVVRDGRTTIILDPFFREKSAEYPETYQPLQLADLGKIDAVFLTHSHPDHFDPASLLRIPPATPVYAPAVDRESLLSIDMAHRLVELGFEDVRTLHWGDTVRAGSIEVRALPFFGEQPTDSWWLHRDVRNQGCTYLIKTSTWTGAFLADSGVDHAGSAKAMATECRAEFGPVDVVFSGYRGWVTYPAQLLGSSVARYMLFVPPASWGVRMQLMNSIDDALDVAERWGARYLCPYGDGGAPWYWNIGLGPRLDGKGSELVGFDPFPERVAEAAASRSVTVDGQCVKSPTEVLLLRPGDSLENIAGPDCPRRVQVPGYSWAFGVAAGTS